MNAAELTIYGALAVLVVLSDLRWWRVAQREHYEPGRVAAIALLWCRVRPVNVTVIVLAAVCIGVGFSVIAVAAVGIVILWAWPLGLGVRPTTSRLVWTPRLRRVVAVSGLIELAVIIAAPSAAYAALLALVVWLPVEIALFVLRPVEARLSKRFVRDAQSKLARVRPDVVAITGSYGKTSTKAYAAHLLSSVRTTVASPASFNNLMGLSRAVNDRLTPGTDVFIAEMGTYGPGEIRALANIFTPRVAAITTIGEAHLERMKTRSTIVAAKSEITEGAEVAVLNVDVPELDALARQLAATKTVVRCSTDPDSDARVRVVDTGAQWIVTVDDAAIATIAGPPGGHAINLAIAVGIVVGLDVPVEAVSARLGQLPAASNRAEIQRTPDGITIIDDTYNANPVGASAALRAARDVAGATGHVFTITPGMIELGASQVERNQAFAREATDGPRMTLAVTGLTNRGSLTSGASGTVLTFPDRASATAAIMPQARSGDVVVYENDLPDHYP